MRYVVHSGADIATAFREKASNIREKVEELRTKGAKERAEADAVVWDKAAEFAENCEIQPTPDVR